MFLAAAHSYLFLCLRLSTECLVSASEQVFNPDEWRGINALLLLYTTYLVHTSLVFGHYYLECDCVLRTVPL